MIVQVTTTAKKIGTRQVSVVLVSGWTWLSSLLDIRVGGLASLRQQPSKVGLMALSGPVHAAVHTVQDVVKVSLPHSETSSGLDNVHWGRCCVKFVVLVLSITSACGWRDVARRNPFRDTADKQQPLRRRTKDCTVKQIDPGRASLRIPEVRRLTSCISR